MARSYPPPAAGLRPSRSSTTVVAVPRRPLDPNGKVIRIVARPPARAVAAPGQHASSARRWPPRRGASRPPTARPCSTRTPTGVAADDLLVEVAVPDTHRLAALRQAGPRPRAAPVRHRLLPPRRGRHPGRRRSTRPPPAAAPGRADGARSAGGRRLRRRPAGRADRDWALDGDARARRAGAAATGRGQAARGSASATPTPGTPTTSPSASAALDRQPRPRRDQRRRRGPRPAAAAEEDVLQPAAQPRPRHVDGQRDRRRRRRQRLRRRGHRRHAGADPRHRERGPGVRQRRRQGRPLGPPGRLPRRVDEPRRQGLLRSRRRHRRGRRRRA